MTETTMHRPAPNTAIDTAFLENQAVLFDERTGRVHELNPSASAVWLLIDGHVTVEDIAAELHDLLAVPIETLRADAELIIADFGRRGLLEGTEAVIESDGHPHTPRPATTSAPRVLARPPDP